MIKFPSFGQWGNKPESVEAGWIGGEATRLAGGKFEDGFSTAAVQYLATPASPQQEKAASISVLDLAGKLWNLPNTIVGLAYGGLGYLACWIGYAFGCGWQTGPPGVALGNNAIQFINNPFIRSTAAATFGNVEVFGSNHPSVKFRGVPEF